jgi:hypothetical protein
LAAQASLGPSWLCAGLCADCLAEAVQNGFLLNSADLAKDRWISLHGARFRSAHLYPSQKLMNLRSSAFLGYAPGYARRPLETHLELQIGQTAHLGPTTTRLASFYSHLEHQVGSSWATKSVNMGMLTLLGPLSCDLDRVWGHFWGLVCGRHIR